VTFTGDFFDRPFTLKNPFYGTGYMRAMHRECLPCIFCSIAQSCGSVSIVLNRSCMRISLLYYERINEQTCFEGCMQSHCMPEG